MDVVPIKPERKAQLEEYAQDTAAALDYALAEYLERERHNYEESVAAIRRGYDDVKAGRTRPAADFLGKLREKHDFPS